ncbi:MAG TPA: hypothetical protein VI462_02200 [Acidimicrobiia bacterium]|jgi:hypothetical protein
MRWLAVLIAGFVAGAASILLANPGTTVQPPAATAAAQVNTGVAGTGVRNPDELVENQPDLPLDAATRAQVAAQLTEARVFALRYPTVTDAVQAGYHLAGGFAPGTGAHYVSYSGLSGPGPVAVDHPEALIYDGTSPTSHVVGLMYYAMTPQAPEGFAGPNDHWHRHHGVCVQYSAAGISVPLPADADVTEAQCATVHGSYLSVTGWMVHAWVVPGWESPQGVFSHSNPDLRCADGTFNTDKAGFCQGT